MRKISNKIVIVAFIFFIFILGVFPYDTDEAYNLVLKKYGYNIGQRTLTTPCKTDGVGVGRVPFGTAATHCETSWFILFNRFPFQIKGEKVTGVLKFNDLKTEIPETKYLFKIESPKGWYSHRISDNRILLTRQEKLPEIGATEGYAYGEQIGINLINIKISPEEWVAQKKYIDLDSEFILSKKWSTFYGQKLLIVESETGGAFGGQYAQYIFTDNSVYVISLYPLKIYDDSSKTYIRNTSAVHDAERVLFYLLPQILKQESK